MKLIGFSASAYRLPVAIFVAGMVTGAAILWAVPNSPPPPIDPKKAMRDNFMMQCTGKGTPLVSCTFRADQIFR
jgi:hypothetical protein